MREIFYNSDITPNSTAELKLLSLYYDRITVVDDAFYSPRFSNTDGQFKFDGVDDFPFVPKSFHEDFRILIDEGILQVVKRDEHRDNPYQVKYAEQIGEIVNSAFDYIFPTHPEKENTKVITEEVYAMMKGLYGFDWGKPIELDFVRGYYTYRLAWFSRLLLEGKTCLTGTTNLTYLFNALVGQLRFSEGSLNGRAQTQSLAADALKLALPDPSLLGFEEILEIRLKFKDELALFRNTLNALEIQNRNSFNGDSDQYEQVLFSQIQKPLNELETKMKNLKSKSFRQFVDKMKDYKTYVPLIGTVVASVPMQYAILVSMGMTLGQSYLEYRETQRELQDNGLYFLLKLRHIA